MSVAGDGTRLQLQKMLSRLSVTDKASKVCFGRPCFRAWLVPANSTSEGLTTDVLVVPCCMLHVTRRFGPQPAELGGQRALDFVLDNPTLQDFNRTLLLDIKLLTVRKAR